ncbi:uncharacterized protein K452DRAFT_326383 [Aplosporella prunicola CBS 121167]|uniref:Zn(2)-C6 fungal-type domain-containing protein n=1 Tax=Aplosporella prunicola CBS 121167 TaxID=1176127 RepID=A0A6A6BGF6_9PEZI|nr:uncharacterized protein K452DRAFT_326383 [Aplosporella prunicola CBS 121167]KAF2142493.1 hypothetical protein K452DRAFT_326383 [Aplosporella prunicola CBS 121167]
MSRPQVGIDRLPARRMSNEPRESMNCKSCRKRKIKCNRMRPTCEACQVFACPCIYDAVPKKRGPKTDVLEALLKRVDGLEKRLHEENKNKSDVEPAPPKPIEDFNTPPSKPALQKTELPAVAASTASVSPTDIRYVAGPETRDLPVRLTECSHQPLVHQRPDILLDTYFARIHGKPYYILDELTTRQRLQHQQLPTHLAHAIYAVSARYAPHPAGYNGASRASEEHAAQARIELDTDEPSIESLQTLLLLAQANYQAGRGKKSYMLSTSAISMAFALELHRELPLMINVPPSEREGRRRLFWACYLMDRFAACGSKRPSLIQDEAVMLRLPSSITAPGAMMLEGDYFRNGSNLQYMAGPGKHNQSSSMMLIGIARILGITNRYLAAGGVKGDSHFPWHSLSNLSKIRHELDLWAAETQDTFSSLETLFGHADSTMLVLSKLVYHLIHCLIYRPFLPMDLAELSITGHHQSWQIEATNLCFLHANAIAELVEIGRASSIIDWPAFVGYCVGTAGTIHVHGAHYRGREGELLSREMHQLAELRFIWAGIQHQRDTLQWIYGCHSELAKSLAGNAMRFSPVLELEDFFDRYPGQAVDGAHVTFADLSMDRTDQGSISLYTTSPQNPYATASSFPLANQPPLLPSQPTQPTSPLERRRKRRATVATGISHSTSQQKRGSSTSAHSSLEAPTSASESQQQEAMSENRDTNHGTNDNDTNNHTRLADINIAASNALSPHMSAFQQQVITPFSPNFTFSAFTPENVGAGSSSQAQSQAQAQSQPHSQPHSQPQSQQQSQPAQSQQSQQQTQPQQQLQDPGSSQQTNAYDPMFGIPTPYEQQGTPGAASAAGSTHTESEKDPFLTLLEQLAENEQSRGGPSELDFFLSGGN